MWPIFRNSYPECCGSHVTNRGFVILQKKIAKIGPRTSRDQRIRVGWTAFVHGHQVALLRRRNLQCQLPRYRPDYRPLIYSRWEECTHVNTFDGSPLQKGYCIKFRYSEKATIWPIFYSIFDIKVEKILKGSLDSIPSPSKSLLTSPSNVLPYYLK